MTTGTRLRIAIATAAIDVTEGKGTVFIIPKEATLQVVSDNGKMVTALWNGRSVEMFALDLVLRGTEIPRSRYATA